VRLPLGEAHHRGAVEPSASAGSVLSGAARRPPGHSIAARQTRGGFGGILRIRALGTAEAIEAAARVVV